MRNKIPVSNLVEILKVVSPINLLAEFKEKGWRLEKWMGEKRTRQRHVNEILNGSKVDSCGARSEKRSPETIRHTIASSVQISPHKTW